MSARGTLSLAAVLLAACHYRQTPVPVQGQHSAIEALAGDWSGGYAGDQSGRSGSITFRITEHGDSAFGDVVMVPAQGIGPRPVDVPAEHLRHAQSPQSLAIAFVGLAGNRVRGTLEPYVAPDCECRVHTAFTGTVAGDVIEGTFVTRSADGMEQTGRWPVTRKRN